MTDEMISDLATEFGAWLRTSKIGGTLVYFQGNLAASREQFPKIAEGANTVWREGYMAGLVHLTQRKRSDGPGYDYIATRCIRKPVQVRVPLSANFDRERSKEKA